MQRVLIADDEPLARERIRERVLALAPDALIHEVGNGAAAVDAIHAWRPDAVFLDIQMPAGDGFSVVAEVGAERMPPTAFVTAYDAHALQAFEIAAVDYLLKPFDDARFERTWRRLERAHAAGALAGEARRFTALLAAIGGDVEATAGAGRGAGADDAPGAGRLALARGAPPYVERFLVRIADRTYPVLVKDVRWMQSEGNYVDLHTPTGTHTIREPLSSVEARLDPARFVRIHRRVIVAIDQIKELQPWFAGDQVLLLRDGTKLRVSRTRREALAARLEGRG